MRLSEQWKKSRVSERKRDTEREMRERYWQCDVLRLSQRKRGMRERYWQSDVMRVSERKREKERDTHTHREREREMVKHVGKAT